MKLESAEKLHKLTCMVAYFFRDDQNGNDDSIIPNKNVNKTGNSGETYVKPTDTSEYHQNISEFQ